MSLVTILCKLYESRVLRLETYMFYVTEDISLAIRSQEICDEMV